MSQLVQFKYLTALVFLVLLVSCTNDSGTDEKDILATFSIADGFKLELVAMEPLISDPVAMEIDELGHVYVVEMHGYPLNVEGNGVVRKLFDDDQDGRFDRSEVFADQLTLPTGIMKWKQGVLVTDPPDLLYLEDSDGDGQADIREVLLTGFARSNPQHNFNSPLYGLDNWVYLANEGTYESQFFGDIFGDQGDEIHFPDHPDAQRLPQNANDLNVKVDLRNRAVEMLAGDSQHGHTFNQWGHHFGNFNWSHIYHEVLAAPYIVRNKDLELPSAMQYVPDYGIGFELYPITQNPEHQLLTDVGAITSACGITWYLGDLFPKPYRDVIFVAEPTHNLVHTDVISHKGATFSSRKQFEQQEFLASTDGWFRPVNFYIGPDGALYMLDFYRKIIEHPEWISEEVLNSGELYAGMDQGRLFRIVPKGNSQTRAQNKQAQYINQATTKELVQYLGHPNIWWRRHAQRLLVDQKDSSAVNELKSYIKSAPDLGVLHALWTLDGLDHFEPEIVTWALGHQTAGIRENAIKIAERHRNEFPELESKLISMVGDSDSKVRYQLLCTLGYYDSKESAEARKMLIFDDLEDPWVQLAGLSASSVNALGLFREAIGRFSDQQSEGIASLFRNLSKTIGKGGNPQEFNRTISLIAEKPARQNSWWQSQTMLGLSETVDRSMGPISRRSEAVLDSYFSETADPELRASSLALLQALGSFETNNNLTATAKQVAIDPDKDSGFRADALKVLAWSDADGNATLFQSLLDDKESTALRQQAIKAMQLTTASETGAFLIEQWKDLTPAERDLAVNVFNTNPQRQMEFLKAVESDQIQASTIGWRRTVRLLNSRDDQVRELARQVLEGNETISDSVWQEYQQVLTLDGNAEEGVEVFDQSCASCHQISGDHGVNFGPDLSAVRNRNKSGIMIDILKPNRSISDGYDLWTLEDNNGEVYSGVIVTENVNTLRLRNIAGEEVTIQQTDIASRSAAEISAMPEGLHHQISPQQMADLLEFLKN